MVRRNGYYRRTGSNTALDAMSCCCLLCSNGSVRPVFASAELQRHDQGARTRCRARNLRNLDGRRVRCARPTFRRCQSDQPAIPGCLRRTPCSGTAPGVAPESSAVCRCPCRAENRASPGLYTQRNGLASAGRGHLSITRGFYCYREFRVPG